MVRGKEHFLCPTRRLVVGGCMCIYVHTHSREVHFVLFNSLVMDTFWGTRTLILRRRMTGRTLAHELVSLIFCSLLVSAREF